MDDLFLKCIPIILQNEGGYVDDPDDPGGETNFGISTRYFPEEDIKNMTPERATEIYYEHFWLPMNLIGINDENAVLQVFDFGVNGGPGFSIMKLQELIGVKADGGCGPITKAAANNYPGDLFADFKEVRKSFYRQDAEEHPKMQKDLEDWLSRVDTTKLS
jgi:lysozyme family protein